MYLEMEHTPFRVRHHEDFPTFSLSSPFAPSNALWLPRELPCIVAPIYLWVDPSTYILHCTVPCGIPCAVPCVVPCVISCVAPCGIPCVVPCVVPGSAGGTLGYLKSKISPPPHAGFVLPLWARNRRPWTPASTSSALVGGTTPKNSLPTRWRPT